MEQRNSLITLGVADLARSRAFYESLGWRGHEVEEAAGATVTRPPAATFYGGYAGYFTDPDSHAWEVAHSPGLALLQDGTVIVPGAEASGAI